MTAPTESVKEQMHRALREAFDVEARTRDRFRSDACFKGSLTYQTPQPCHGWDFQAGVPNPRKRMYAPPHGLVQTVRSTYCQHRERYYFKSVGVLRRKTNARDDDDRVFLRKCVDHNNEIIRDDDENPAIVCTADGRAIANDRCWRAWFQAPNEWMRGQVNDPWFHVVRKKYTLPYGPALDNPDTRPSWMVENFERDVMDREHDIPSELEALRTAQLAQPQSPQQQPQSPQQQPQSPQSPAYTPTAPEHVPAYTPSSPTYSPTAGMPDRPPFVYRNVYTIEALVDQEAPGTFTEATLRLDGPLPGSAEGYRGPSRISLIVRRPAWVEPPSDMSWHVGSKVVVTDPPGSMPRLSDAASSQTGTEWIDWQTTRRNVFELRLAPRSPHYAATGASNASGERWEEYHFAEDGITPVAGPPAKRARVTAKPVVPVAATPMNNADDADDAGGASTTPMVHCCACMDEEATFAYYPCGHKCVCAKCCKHATMKKQCPVCRAKGKPFRIHG